ncbi:Uncharacterized conserved protein, DUF302 family [Meinhardsimonia xiamenensis]|jgi:uncharacterized protein (DUF302 family)|uniref:Uncharacterized conserved protein, DUF302 family n=1 Tax=Meinhardsimonia xiamenensis TaxID=990712 RepID=A0A1G9GG44_9RHOB|nr:DUF302 domain-containing protein [Meinhardsimonia xiamenensis]PRX31904.1 uncharacterized protein (DUF302 family) [Meinhardsimonia xiamenensis]SDK99634.1 Uncharacterized conserved protein, DUF302 family [Meinhardsimonia xiamenensis]
MRKLAVTMTTAVALAAQAAAAGEAITYVTSDSFEDASFALESAIVDRGLVIDYVSHVGDMLNRTGADVGSDVKIFDAADIYIFCSAVLSRKVMEADPMNIAHCPYGVFVAERGGQVMIGYRDLPDGPMAEVEALLDAIAREAAGQ